MRIIADIKNIAIITVPEYRHIFPAFGTGFSLNSGLSRKVFRFDPGKGALLGLVPQ